MRVTRIQDDGNRFILYGEGDLYIKLCEILEETALGVSVTRSEEAAANILYTENNRDIVLRILYDHTEKASVKGLLKPQTP